MINHVVFGWQPVRLHACRYYMDLTAQDVRAIVQQHTRLTDEDTAELLAASMTPQGLARSQHPSAWLHVTHVWGRPDMCCPAGCSSSAAEVSAVCAGVHLPSSFGRVTLAVSCTETRPLYCSADALPAGSPAPSPAKARSPAAKRCVRAIPSDD